MTPVKHLLREPLIHFLLLGLALFAVHSAVAPDARNDRQIVVTAGQVYALGAQFEKLWGRSPTQQELAGLVDSWVHDEILYREGVKLGLDRDDAVVKRRVRQKLEVLAEEELATAAPSDADLSVYLASNHARFSRPARVSFEQVLLDPATVGGDTARVVAGVRAALERGADPAMIGQATLLPSREDDRPLDLVARDFGDEFTRALAQLPAGEWTGPVRSGFGVHVVRITRRAGESVPPLDSVRAEVTREWENARREHALAESYRRLRAAYDVRVEAALPPVGEPRSGPRS